MNERSLTLISPRRKHADFTVMILELVLKEERVFGTHDFH
jgi:hypothetical protein